MSPEQFDICIAGAGPAGTTLALSLASSGKRILVLDRDTFPRDKICGDALSGKVISVLKRMPREVYSDFLDHPGKTSSWGIRFVSPGMHSFFLPFSLKNDEKSEAPGYIFPRKTFDYFLISQLKKFENISFFEGKTVKKIEKTADKVHVFTEDSEYTALVIAVATGIGSDIPGIFDAKVHDHFKPCTGLRFYHKNVTGFTSENHIELFFFRELLPFYFWVFPPVDGISNTGLGMLRKDVVTRKVNLNRLFHEFIDRDPELRKRFINAIPVGKPEAATLPLYCGFSYLSSGRALLLGDAASLVDPFTGEGIGNAMASGETAARVILDCFETGDFSGKALKVYDHRIRKRLRKEMRAGRIFQALARSRYLFNLVVRIASRAKFARKILAKTENLR